MATKATVYKAQLNIANMDIHYYAEYNLTLAKHPSETTLRLIMRLTAFVLNANEDLLFCKGISQDDEPDLWQKSLDSDIELWIDLGQPDEKRIKKACGRSKNVIIYTYQEGMAKAWFEQVQKSLKRFKNLQVVYLDFTGDIDLFDKRSLDLQCNFSDNELSLINDENTLLIKPTIWKDYE